MSATVLPTWTPHESEIAGAPRAMMAWSDQGIHLARFPGGSGG